MNLTPSGALRRAIHRINAEFDGGKMGLTLPQASLLAALERHGPINQTALVDLACIDRSTVSNMLERLEDKLWVKRERPRHDKRAQLASITRDGIEALRSAESEMAALEAGIMLLVPRADRAAFKRGLAAIAEADRVG